MGDRQERMMKNHARTGITHDLDYTFTHSVAVAVDLALGTSRLVVLERTAFQLLHGIIFQVAAFLAELMTRSVVCPAVDADHAADGINFSPDPSAHYPRRKGGGFFVGC